MFNDPLDKQFSKSLLDAARAVNEKTVADAKSTKEDKEQLVSSDEDMIGQFDEASRKPQPVHIGSYGFTTFTHHPKDDIVEISHGGNMGNSVEHSVKPNVDAKYGRGTFDKLASRATKTSGSPDYMWSMHVPASHFSKVTGHALQPELKLEARSFLKGPHKKYHDPFRPGTALHQALKDVEALGAKQRAEREAQTPEKAKLVAKAKLAAARAMRQTNSFNHDTDKTQLDELKMFGWGKKKGGPPKLSNNKFKRNEQKRYFNLGADHAEAGSPRKAPSTLHPDIRAHYDHGYNTVMSNKKR